MTDKSKITRYTDLFCLSLDNLYTSEDCWMFDIDKINFDLTPDLIKRLREAMDLCKKNRYFCIEISFDGMVEYLDPEGNEVDDWRTGVEYFKVYKDWIYLYAQHKHNVQAQIESEPFYISADLRPYSESDALRMQQDEA